MGKSSRTKRRAVRSAKRSKQNNWWTIITVLVLIVGVVLIVVSRMSEPEDVGPFVADARKAPGREVNQNSDWHAALGFSMLMISFVMLLSINLLQAWGRRRVVAAGR